MENQFRKLYWQNELCCDAAVQGWRGEFELDLDSQFQPQSQIMKI